MHHFLAITGNTENRENFADLLATLAADPGVVLRASLDGSKGGRGDKDGSIEFYADEEAGERLSAKISGWRFVPTGSLKQAPDNNEIIDTLGPNPEFTDHRVKQPEATQGMQEYLLVGGKTGTDFNAAATVLLKEPSVKLVGWVDHRNKAKSSLSGMFTVVAKDAETVEAVARKLPQWVIVPPCTNR